MRRCLVALCVGGLLVWGSCGPLPYWVPQTFKQKALQEGGASSGESAGGVWSLSHPLLLPEVEVVRGGGCPHPTSPGAGTVYGPRGKSEQCSVGALAGWVGGVTWLGRGETIIRHFPLGIGHQPCLAEMAGK